MPVLNDGFSISELENAESLFIVVVMEILIIFWRRKIVIRPVMLEVFKLNLSFCLKSNQGNQENVMKATKIQSEIKRIYSKDDY